MKKTVLIALIIITGTFAANSQVFDDARTLSKGSYMIGLEPAFASNNFAMFIHGGFGLGSGSDLGVKLGFGWGNTYFGMEYEKAILGSPNVSVFLGGHAFNGFGFDGKALITFPLRPLFLTTGVDMDMNFYKDGQGGFEMGFPFWIPFEFEFYLRQHLSLIFEAEVGLNSPAATIVGGGIAVYF